MKFSPDGESEIIRVADSEIVPCGTVKLPPPHGGGSDEEWQPKGLRKDNTLGGHRFVVALCCQRQQFHRLRMSRFHPARAGFHSARKGGISLLLSERDSARYALGEEHVDVFAALM